MKMLTRNLIKERINGNSLLWRKSNGFKQGRYYANENRGYSKF